MERYELLDMEVIAFEDEDVIVTSVTNDGDTPLTDISFRNEQRPGSGQEKA